MHNNRSRKHKILLDTWEPLVCLLAFFLLVSLIPAAVSFQMQSISSYGTITHASATLLITDSTPEGPVPYKIDGNSEYQTSSSYSIPAGVHTIELPSPYTSPLSDITYYFSYWQDGSTDNPRTITLSPGASTSLHGVYSTSSTPPSPPPPEPDITMPSDYLAYTGWETGTGMDDNRMGLSTYWNLFDATVTRDTSVKYSGASSVRGYKTGTTGGSRLEFKFWASGLITTEVYTSLWTYIANIEYYPGWWEVNSMREQWYNEGNLGISVQGSFDNMFWYLGYLVGPGGYRSTAEWYYEIGENGLIGKRDWDGVGSDYKVEYNGHGVPLYRWFRLETYRLRSPTKGIFKIWITDPYHPDPSKRETRLLFGAENTFTSADPSRLSRSDLFFMPMKIYGLSATIYWDDLYVYNYNVRGG